MAPPKEPDEEAMDISDEESASRAPTQPASRSLPLSTAHAAASAATYNPYADAYGPYAYYYQNASSMIQSSHYDQPPIQSIYHPYAKPNASVSYAQTVKKNPPNAAATKTVAPVAYTPISIPVSTPKKPLLKPVAKPVTRSKWDVPAPAALSTPALNPIAAHASGSTATATATAASQASAANSSNTTSEVWPDSLK